MDLSPKIPCRERSGYPCDKLVTLRSPHCGDSRHFPGANGGLPIRRNRSAKIALTVNEDYDLIDESPDLDPVTFDARRVFVSRPALEAWDDHPKKLQARIRLALTQGGYWRTVTGSHLLEIGADQIVLSSNGQYCESYTRLPPPPLIETGDPIEALSEPEWDRDEVVLSPRAVRQFAGRHGVDEDSAVGELFDLLDDAATRGKHHRIASGNHVLSVDGFRLTLTVDGRTIVSYRTLHAERTPSDVRNKVPSRFGHKRPQNPEEWAAWMAERDDAVRNVAPENCVSVAEIASAFDPERSRITAGVIAIDDPDRQASVQAVRHELREAEANGRWMAGDLGCHLLVHGGRTWTISPNGHGVLDCEPSWPGRK